MSAAAKNLALRTTRDRSSIPRLAKRIGVYEQCLQAGYDPVDGIIEARRQAVEAGRELIEYLRDKGPVPWYLEGRGDAPRTTATMMLRDMRDLILRIDEGMMPYCHPKLSAQAITGEDGGPVTIEQIERVIVDPNAQD